MSELARVAKRYDGVLVATVVALALFGLLMVYSASQGRASGDPLYFVKRQVLWIVCGLVAMGAASFIDYNRLRAYAAPIYAVNALSLVLVLLFGPGKVGAQRWIPLGPFNFQPSEFAKIALVVCLAAFFSMPEEDVSIRRRLLQVFGLLGLPVFLIFLQPDLGTALVVAALLMGILFAAGTPLRYYLVIVLVGVLVAAFAIQFHILQPYQINRLIVFINPDVDPLGAGYNLTQSKIAIGSGQLTGRGLFSGTQTNLRFLPATHTDFIFAVVGEELGFIGSALLIGLYFVLISRAIRVATVSRNLFGALVAAGIVSMWLFQVMVNIGMTIGIMPITGIPLPFVSYGGSSMVANMLAAGLLLNIHAMRYG